MMSFAEKVRNKSTGKDPAEIQTQARPSEY